MGAEGEVTGFLMVSDTSVYLFHDYEKSNLRHTRWQCSAVLLTLVKTRKAHRVSSPQTRSLCLYEHISCYRSGYHQLCQLLVFCAEYVSHISEHVQGGKSLKYVPSFEWTFSKGILLGVQSTWKIGKKASVDPSLRRNKAPVFVTKMKTCSLDHHPFSLTSQGWLSCLCLGSQIIKDFPRSQLQRILLASGPVVRAGRKQAEPSEVRLYNSNIKVSSILET